MGEIIVEIMRDGVDKPLDKAETFKGPYPSGAPAIFIDTVARLGHKAAIVGGVGDDDFGKCLLDRLEGDGVDCSNIIKNDRISFVRNVSGLPEVAWFADDVLNVTEGQFTTQLNIGKFGFRPGASGNLSFKKTV